MNETIRLSGDYGYLDYRVGDLSETLIDATEARWIVSNLGGDLNRYPVLIDDSDSVVLRGGTIDGEVPLDTDWTDTYVNSSAVTVRDSSNMLIEDWRISRAWDGIRMGGDESNDFAIARVWLSDIRDDAVENDSGQSGTITDSLFDGVFVGVSLFENGTPDQTENVVTLDNVLIRMESYEYRGNVTHQSPFKMAEGVSPSLAIHDSVFAIEDPDHAGQHYQRVAWDSVKEASGNYFLNLSDTPLPEDYPLPPDGFTVLEGSAARTHWEGARDAWIDEFHGEDDLGRDMVSLVETDDPQDTVTKLPQEPGFPEAADEKGNLLSKFFDIFKKIFSIFGGAEEDGAGPEPVSEPENAPATASLFAMLPSLPPATEDDIPDAPTDENWEDPFLT